MNLKLNYIFKQLCALPFNGLTCIDTFMTQQLIG